MSSANTTQHLELRTLQEVSTHQQDDGESKQESSHRASLLRSEKKLHEATVHPSGLSGPSRSRDAKSHLLTVSGEIDAHGVVQSDSDRPPLMRSEKRHHETGDTVLQSSSHSIRVVSPRVAEPVGSGSGLALLRSEKSLHEASVHPSSLDIPPSSLLMSQDLDAHHPAMSEEFRQNVAVQAGPIRQPIMRSEKRYQAASSLSSDITATEGDSKSHNINLHLFAESGELDSKRSMQATSVRQPLMRSEKPLTANDSPTSMPVPPQAVSSQAVPVSPLVASPASSVAGAAGVASVTPVVTASGLVSPAVASTVSSPNAVSQPVAPAPLPAVSPSNGASVTGGAASINPPAPQVAGYITPQPAPPGQQAGSAMAAPWSPAYNFPAPQSVPLITTPTTLVPSDSRRLAASDVMINSTVLPMAEATSTAHKVAAMMGLFFIILLAVVGVMLVRQITALTEFRNSSKSSLKSKSAQPKSRPSRALKFHQTSKRAQDMLEARQEGQLIPPGALLNEALMQAGIPLDDPSLGLPDLETEIRDKTCEMRLVRDPATLETKLIRFVRLLRIKVLMPSTKGSSTLELFELSRDTSPMTDMLLPLQDRQVRHEDTRGPLTVKLKLHEKDLYSLCQQVLFERLELEFDWQDKCLLREEDEATVFVEERESKNHPSLFTWYQVDEFTVVVDRQRAMKEPGSYLGLPDQMNFQTSCSRTGNHILYSWEWQRQTSERLSPASKRMTVTSIQAADSDVRIIDATALSTQRTISCSEDSVPIKKMSSVRSSITTSPRVGTRRSLAAAAREKRRVRSSIASAASSKAGSSSDSDK